MKTWLFQFCLRLMVPLITVVLAGAMAGIQGNLPQIKEKMMTTHRYRATPFGVRIDHLTNDGETHFSEYIPDSLDPPITPPAGRSWRKVTALSVGLVLGFMGPGLLQQVASLLVIG